MKKVKIYLPDVDDVPLEDGTTPVEEWISNLCQLKLGVTPGAWMVRCLNRYVFHFRREFCRLLTSLFQMYGLWSSKSQVWLAPDQQVSEEPELELRIRFKVSSISDLKDRDFVSFNYLYHQASAIFQDTYVLVTWVYFNNR